MKLSFTKMHGCGNDYIYFDCFKQPIDDPEKLSLLVSDRHFGIGGDGIVLIAPSDKADAKMRMFNIDGSEGKMCGNAIRCVGKYLSDNGLVSKDIISIETLAGIKTLELTKEDGVVTLAKVDMEAAILTPSQIPVNLEGDIIVNQKLTIDQKDYSITCVSMGNPHCIVFVDDVDEIELEKIGPKFEKNEIFPEQVNTEFVKVIDKNTIQMRVWERGSGETLACGTGACASVVATVLNGFANKNEEVLVHLRGGDLKISYTDETVLMTGSATKVFDGEIEI